MKRILSPILIALTFTVMFSSTSFADWTRVGENVTGDSFYVDFERIRKHEGYVYYWDLSNLLKPDKDGDLSYKKYSQGDCKLFRVKGLTEVYYKQEMGRGNGKTNTSKNPQWKYPIPNSVLETILKAVCSR